MSREGNKGFHFYIIKRAVGRSRKAWMVCNCTTDPNAERHVLLCGREKINWVYRQLNSPIVCGGRALDDKDMLTIEIISRITDIDGFHAILMDKHLHGLENRLYILSALKSLELFRFVPDRTYDDCRRRLLCAGTTEPLSQQRPPFPPGSGSTAGPSSGSPSFPSPGE
jgi:hypothetical protein